jgi:hypothetical protein
MGEKEIELLLADRSLVREAFRDEQVASIWAKAAASHADAGVQGLTNEGAFQHLYTAALQAAIATLAAHGFRVKSTSNHYRTFYALRMLDVALHPAGTRFDEMRGTRNDSVYDATHDAEDLTGRLAEARWSMPGSLAALRASILSVRPTIATRLPPIE